MKYFWYVFWASDVLVVAAILTVVVLKGRKRAQHIESAPTADDFRRWEARAPGWKIRCLKCGLTEPYGKYGIRQMAAGKSYTWGYCPQCDALRFYVIESGQNAFSG